MEKRRQALLYFYPDLEKVSWSTVRKFYIEEVSLSYKRVGRPKDPVVINYNSLTNLLVFLKEKVLKGYKIVSLDETGFGGACLQKYSWVEKGKRHQPLFKKQNNLTLLVAISPLGIEAFQFLQGGLNMEYFRDFLIKFYKGQYQ